MNKWKGEQDLNLLWFWVFFRVGGNTAVHEVPHWHALGFLFSYLAPTSIFISTYGLNTSLLRKEHIFNSNQWLTEFIEVENLLFLCHDLYSDYSDFKSWPHWPIHVQWSLLLAWRSPAVFLPSENERPSTYSKIEVLSLVLKYPRGIPFSNHQNKFYCISLQPPCTLPYIFKGSCRWDHKK